MDIYTAARLGKEVLDRCVVHERVNGVPLNYHRRRYGGGATFTWVRFHQGGKWHDAGDPWQSVRVPKADLNKLTTEPHQCGRSCE